MLNLDLKIYNASIDLHVHANSVEFIYVSLLVWS